MSELNNHHSHIKFTANDNPETKIVEANLVGKLFATVIHYKPTASDTPLPASYEPTFIKVVDILNPAIFASF